MALGGEPPNAVMQALGVTGLRIGWRSTPASPWTVSLPSDPAMALKSCLE